MSYNIQQSALDYLDRGWAVVPVRAREKYPLIAWQVYQQHCASVGDVRAWFARWPNANVGIVTGVVSGLVVIDVDPRHGGNDSLAELNANTDHYRKR